jgi:hypothetical protein
MIIWLTWLFGRRCQFLFDFLQGKTLFTEFGATEFQLAFAATGRGETTGTAHAAGTNAEMLIHNASQMILKGSLRPIYDTLPVRRQSEILHYTEIHPFWKSLGIVTREYISLISFSYNYLSKSE